MEGWKLVNGYEGEHPYPITPGTHRLDFRGTEWRFDSISAAPEGNSLGKIQVSRPCAECERDDCPNYWHRDGRIEDWFYPSVIFAKIVPDTGEPDDDTRTRYVVRQGRTGYKIVKADGSPADDRLIRAGLGNSEAQGWANLLNQAYELGRKEGIIGLNGVTSGD